MTYGCRSKLNRRGKPQVLVYVSTYKGNPFWISGFLSHCHIPHIQQLNKAPGRPEASDVAQVGLQERDFEEHSEAGGGATEPRKTRVEAYQTASPGLLKRYIWQPFETWLFPPIKRETTIYKLQCSGVQCKDPCSPLLSDSQPSGSLDLFRSF